MTAIATLIMLFATSPASAMQTVESRSLGIAVRSMTVWDSLVVREGDKPILYAGTYTGIGNARVIRYDYTTGTVQYFSLPNAMGAYGLAWDNGDLYVGTINKASFFRIRDSEDEVTDLGSPAPEEQYIWRLDRGSSGKIYACTYPGAKLLEYDPSTGQMRDHGAMHPGRQYAIALAAGEGSKVFVGIGTPAALVAHDTATDETTEIPLHGYESAAFAYPTYDQGILYVRFAGDDSVLIFDADTLALLVELDSAESGIKYSISKPIPGTPIRIGGFPEGPKIFDPVLRSLVDAEFDLPSLYDPISGVRLEISPTTVSAFDNETNEQLDSVDISKDGDGMRIMSVSMGPDGRVYGGVYNLLHLWRYDSDTEELVDLGSASPGYTGQYYDFCSVGSRLYMGSYTHAVVTEYDTAQPWNLDAKPTTNPRVIGPIGEDQYRPLALLAGADGVVYVGSTPTYGQVQGAIVTLDTRTDALAAYRGFLGDHSVSSLALGNEGRIFVGTTLFASTPGHQFDPPEAMVVEWNREQSEVEFSIAPVPNARTIHSLIAGEGDALIGCADSTIFCLDVKTRDVLHTMPLEAGPITRMRRGPDGEIYGISSKQFIRLATSESGTIEVTSLGLGGEDFDISPKGEIYFARGTELHVFDGLAAATGSSEERP